MPFIYRLASKNSTLFTVPVYLGPIHTTAEEFENGGFDSENPTRVLILSTLQGRILTTQQITGTVFKIFV